MKKNLNEDDLAKFAKSVEQPSNEDNVNASGDTENDTENQQPEEERVISERKRNALQKLEEAQERKKAEIENEKKINGLGYIKVPLETLPTKGLFYPSDTVIWIRAAVGEEIRHWSQTNETELTEVDEALNYILERCTSVKIPGKIACYKDLKEIDRFYVILSIRDFTFPDGNNELMIKIDEKNEVPLKKDDIDFIKLDDNIMKYYNQERKCFTINSYNIKTSKGRKEIQLIRPLNLYMPSVGVTSFLKSYIQRKNQRQEKYDEVFLNIAPLVIPDYRGLNDDSYAKIIGACDYFGTNEYSIIRWVKNKVSDSIKPKFIYKDREGMEQSAPLNFQGGILSLFLYTVDDII